MANDGQSSIIFFKQEIYNHFLSLSQQPIVSHHLQTRTFINHHLQTTTFINHHLQTTIWVIHFHPSYSHLISKP
ncbi:hypothetical protein HanXRQr2_Chr17g0831531 [Helianthus annuus]|uniref:Uncharacterized protein n=1 Tax=Helianthus annuus TaxID=4232 RepID=A0A251RU75_HELAN|nr:hypothetical protein HanXRQr2_Chr17g0831531 [Helianthus annuus]